MPQHNGVSLRLSSSGTPPLGYRLLFVEVMEIFIKRIRFNFKLNWMISHSLSSRVRLEFPNVVIVYAAQYSEACIMVLLKPTL